MMKTHPTDVGGEGKVEASVLPPVRAVMLLSRWEDSQTPLEKSGRDSCLLVNGKGKECVLSGFLGGYGFLGNEEKGSELKQKRKINLQIENKAINDRKN